MLLTNHHQIAEKFSKQNIERKRNLMPKTTYKKVYNWLIENNISFNSDDLLTVCDLLSRWYSTSVYRPQFWGALPPNEKLN